MTSASTRLANLPVLPTSGVGSYAIPGWMFPIRKAIRAGELGEQDIDEAFSDATRVVVAEQVEAGLDIISDGELKRQRFVYEMYDRLQGLERIRPRRKLGVPGYDMAPAFKAVAPVVADAGLGLVAELQALRQIEPERPLKIAFPGPLTFAMNIDPAPHYGPGTAGEDRLLEDLTNLIAQTITELAGAGADVIQLDEPGFPNPPFGRPVAAGAEVINQAIRTATAKDSFLCVHVCFGNNASRPFVRRDLGRLLPGLKALECAELGLEFANREMADCEHLAELSERHRIAAGIIDVKSFHVESADEVAARIRRVLEFMRADRLSITSDCGFSAIPRWLAEAKIKAMVAGTRLVRETL